jgi:hypothetical protein
MSGDGAHAQPRSGAGDAVVVRTVERVARVAQPKEQLNHPDVVAGRQTHRVVEDGGGPQVVQPQVPRPVAQRAQLPGHMVEQDVAGPDVHLLDVELGEASVVRIRVLERISFDAAHHAGPGLVGAGRRAKHVQLQLQHAVGALVEQSPVEVRVSQASTATLKVGLGHDAQVAAGAEAVRPRLREGERRDQRQRDGELPHEGGVHGRGGCLARLPASR